jgi:serine/threonine-protein kinase RsbW
MKRAQLIIYGIDNYSIIIDKVIKELMLNGDCFDIRLILTEALANAFKHGNNSDKSIPIKLSYYNDGQTVFLEIEDSNINNNKVDFSGIGEISDEQLLNESGKGLFLIKALADNVEVNNNILTIKKQI